MSSVLRHTSERKRSVATEAQLEAELVVTTKKIIRPHAELPQLPEGAAVAGGSREAPIIHDANEIPEPLPRTPRLTTAARRTNAFRGDRMLPYDNVSIETPPWSGVPRYVAELWRMHKGDDVAVCTVWTHPDGANFASP